MKTATEQITVRINAGSKTAIEINPVPEGKSEEDIFKPGTYLFVVGRLGKLRTFEIDYSDIPVTSKKAILNGFLEGSILEAEVLDNRKIRIL